MKYAGYGGGVKLLFNLNDFLKSISVVLDVIETDIFGVALNHSKRIAYISLKMGEKLNLGEEDIFDIVSLSLLHDNGATLKILHDQLRGTANEKLNIIESMQEHCTIGEDNVREYPFLSEQKNIIKYHHEKFDGSGFFKLSGDDIPIMAQIISFADTLDLNFDLGHLSENTITKNMLINYILLNDNKLFSHHLVKIFLGMIESKCFFEDLCDDRIDEVLTRLTPPFSKELTYSEIRNMTQTFSRIIDAKSKFTQDHSSGLANKLEKMLKFYSIDQDDTAKLLIAADLHDLGKLAISNSILNKPSSLTNEEFNEIKKHSEICKKSLEGIQGFADITKWIYHHHEKLDGSGYPQGLIATELPFYSRLLGTLDIYQALREERPYRKGLSHIEALSILNQMVKDSKVDATIVKDIDVVFLNEYT